MKSAFHPAPQPAQTAMPWTALMWVTLLFLLIQAITFNQIEEDAFIYLRPAQNILDGCGYVFNCNGPVVETGTSPIWQAIVTFTLWASPLHELLSLKLIEICISALSLWLLTRLSSRLIRKPELVIVPALLLCISVPFYTWSQRGMGSAQHLLVFIWFIYACLYRCRGGWVLPAYLLFLSRPEGFAFVAIGLGWIWLTRPWQEALRSSVLLASLCLATEVARIIYFHDLLPNSIYYKLRGDLAMGWSVTRLFFLNSPLTFLLLALLLTSLQKNFWNKERLFIAIMSAMGLLWAVIGEDWKESNRALVPGLSMICVWIGIAMDKLSIRWPRSTITLLALLILPILLVSKSVHSYYQTKPNALVHRLYAANDNFSLLWENYKALLKNPDNYIKENGQFISDPILGHNHLATTGKFIAANYPKGITIVYDQIGQTPWYAGTDKTFIDGAGLTDPVIGRYQFDHHADPPLMKALYIKLRNAMLTLLTGAPAPKENLKQIIDDIFAQRPELIILMTHHKNPAHFVMHALLVDPRLGERYYPAYQVNRLNTFYHRNDIPMPAVDTIPSTTVVKRLAPPATGH